MDFTEAQRARDLLAQHGAVEAQPAREWAGTFALPSELEEFYRDVGPVNVSVPGYGNSTFLPRLSALWEHQVGYRFHGHSGERLADWDDDWIVIGDVGADPYIYSRRTKTVLFARHGEGAWDPEPLYRSPITMVACVASLGTIAVQAGPDFTDDSGRVRSIYAAAGARRLREYLTRPGEAEALLSTYGWA